METQDKIFIGIDPGVNTGISVWHKSEKKFSILQKTSIIDSFEIVKGIYEFNKDKEITVIIEDARQRSGSVETRLGAGSVRRDCQIWEEFLKYNNFRNFRFQKPIKGMTKLSREQFKKITGVDCGNEHARDAGMIVFGY